MKKLIQIILAVFVCGLGFYLSIKYDDHNTYSNKTQKKETNIDINKPSTDVIKKNVSLNSKQSVSIGENILSTHEHEKIDINDALTILPKEQIEEIKELTSRKQDGLKIEADNTVDLKKRYSHVVVSYIDENGVKQQKEL